MGEDLTLEKGHDIHLRNPRLRVMDRNKVLEEGDFFLKDALLADPQS